MADYSELKRLAEACPWEKIEGFEYQASGGKAFCLGDGPHNHLITTFDQRFQKYIEAANPTAVLALIAENEAIKAQFDECARLFVDATEQACKAQRERDQLKAENEALHDSIRYEEARFRLELAESERLRRLIGECVEYLNTNSLTQISSGSILHRKMSDALSQGEPAPVTSWLPRDSCMICGSMHGGLPCPKMTPMAMDGKGG